MNTVSKYLSLVKFAHTILAMPFAAVGFVYAYATLPAGAHDAYPKGAKVTHNGKRYTSNVDANTWEPPTQWTEFTGEE